jgi:RNA-binding protein YhbY
MKNRFKIGQNPITEKNLASVDETLANKNLI